MYHGYDELLGDSAVDAVVISLPNFLHFPASLAALQAGKHVLCEKPPTLNVAEVESLRDEARTRGLTYAFSRQMRFNSEMLGARRAIAEGRLGHIYHARAQWLRARGIPLGLGGWFTEKSRAGGGAMIDIGIHALDAAWFLVGCPKPLSVTAQTGAYFASTVPEGIRFDVDDSGFAFLRFAGGLSLHLEVSWAINLAAENGAHDIMNTVLHGDLATLQINPPGIFILDPTDGKTMRMTPTLSEQETLLQKSEPPGSDFGRQMADFSNAVRNGTPPTNNVDQAVDLMKMLMAIYESSASGKEVRFMDPVKT
jgi:predicted dehydrogenase